LSYFFAVISGLVQGLTEFLPVSSSGHLCLFQNVFGIADVGTDSFTFSVLLHLATLAAVLTVYREDVWKLIKSFISLCGKLLTGRIKQGTDTGEKFVVCVVIATLPLIFAVFVSDYVELLSSNTKLVGGIMLINAAMLFLSDLIGRNNRKTTDDMKPRNALVVGLVQLLAIVPGLSRSGSTITGGLTQGLDRETAVRFSFILSIPAILGANIFEIPKLLKDPVPSCDILPMVMGMAAALISGIAAMKLLQLIAKRSSFKPFAFYCAAVGTAALIFG